MSKVSELTIFTHKYSIVPAKLTVLYKKGATMEELYGKAIVTFPILMQMEKPTDDYFACVFKNDASNEIFLFIKDDISYSTIAHESVHITSRIFECTGSPINESTEEFFAYILDYTFEQICVFVRDVLKIKIPLTSYKQ